MITCFLNSRSTALSGTYYWWQRSQPRHIQAMQCDEPITWGWLRAAWEHRGVPSSPGWRGTAQAAFERYIGHCNTEDVVQRNFRQKKSKCWDTEGESTVCTGKKWLPLQVPCGEGWERRLDRKHECPWHHAHFTKLRCHTGKDRKLSEYIKWEKCNQTQIFEGKKGSFYFWRMETNVFLLNSYSSQ